MRHMKSALLVLLLAASTAQAALPKSGGSPAHDYILGRFAFADDRLGDAARYFDQARKLDPADATLGRRAFELAVAAGDQKLAFSLANQLAAAKQDDSNVALVRLTDAVDRKDWKAVEVARAGLAGAGYAVVVAPIVEAWSLYARGDTTAALAKLNPDTVTGFTKSYLTEQRAYMFAAVGRYAEASAIYHELRVSTGNAFLRVGEADALQQMGQAVQAAVVLESAPRNAVTTAASARLAAGKRIGGLADNPRDGLGWAFARLSTDLAREKPVPLALMFARLATFMAPDNATTWMVTGDILARGGRADAAIEAYSHIAASDPLADTARDRRAEVMAGNGQGDAARALLEASTKASGATADSWMRLGDYYRRAENHAEAARAYGKAIALSPEGSASWTAYFLRGSAAEQAGDWAAAEPDLRRALALAPEEAMVLNYLGYALLDRSLTPDTAQALIAKASALQPDDGFITDSLGWALFRRGKFDEAVPVLERAVAAQPSDPTINEHLGDAYWRTGRRIEARFRWRAATELEPTPKAKELLLAKLDYGLDVATAAR